MITFNFQCDLCLKHTHKGATLVYEQGEPGAYKIKDCYKRILNPNCDSNLLVKHVCEDCCISVNLKSVKNKE